MMEKLIFLVIVFILINIIFAGTASAATPNSMYNSHTPQINQTHTNIKIINSKIKNTGIKTNIKFPGIHGIFINPNRTSLSNIDPTKLKTQGITDIYVLTSRKDPKDTLEPFITKFTGTGIKVYAWVESFKDSNGNWINPENNTKLENQIIKNITSIVKNYKVSGIMLDYIRYPGNAYKYPNATDDVDSFVATIKNNINIINNKNIPGKPKILLTAALMPEGSSNDYYYAQNYTRLSQYLDYLSPMIYVENYKKPTSWIGTTTQYIKAQANGKPVVAILKTYKYNSDAIPSPLTTNQLNIDIGSALNNGSYGYELFRYGLLNPSFTVDTTPPKVSSTTPINLKTGVSRTNTIYIKFNENIKSSINFNSISIKNLNTNKFVPNTKKISENTLKIKNTTTQNANTWYQVFIPAASIKDYAGNKLRTTYTFKFKTGA